MREIQYRLMEELGNITRPTIIRNINRDRIQRSDLIYWHTGPISNQLRHQRRQVSNGFNQNRQGE